VLAAEMMRGRLRGDDDFAQSANAALGKNTDAMVQLVESSFGQQAATQFRTLWAAHVAALFNYARGVANDDRAVRDQARSTLNTFETDLAGFFSAASQGRLPRDTARAAVLSHVDHLLRQTDLFAAKDYAASNKLYRETYAHTYGLGRAIAGALLPPADAAALQVPTWRLRSELGKLLGEHVALLVAATRAGVANAPDFSAAGEAVNGNTRDLAGAVDTLFGAQAATSFQSLWADHVDQLMAYTAGVAMNDTKRRDEAKTKLADFENRFAAFLSTAAGGRMLPADLVKALTAHDQNLQRQIDTYAAKDYPTAHDIAYTTYQHMLELAAQLADAFGATVAARLPAGGAPTGYGGKSAVVERR
jgi:hypothetical protein